MEDTLTTLVLSSTGPYAPARICHGLRATCVPSPLEAGWCRIRACRCLYLFAGDRPLEAREGPTSYYYLLLVSCLWASLRIRKSKQALGGTSFTLEAAGRFLLQGSPRADRRCRPTAATQGPGTWRPFENLPIPGRASCATAAVRPIPPEAGEATWILVPCGTCPWPALALRPEAPLPSRWSLCITDLTNVRRGRRPWSASRPLMGPWVRPRSQLPCSTRARSRSAIWVLAARSACG